MSSVRFSSSPPTVMEVPRDKAATEARREQPKAHSWPGRFKKALPAAFSRSASRQPPPSALSPFASSSVASALDEPRGRSMAQKSLVSEPKPRVLPPPLHPAEPITRFENHTLRYDVLRLTLERFESNVERPLRPIVQTIFAPEMAWTKESRQNHAMALTWTGLLEAPSSLERDHTLFLLFRAARFVATLCPQWCVASHLAHGRELLGKFTAALSLQHALDTARTSAERLDALQQADVKVERFMQSEMNFDVPRSAVSCPSRSLANEFTFVLFSLELTRLSRESRIRVLQECNEDLHHADIHDFLTSLQYHRTALAAHIAGGEEGFRQIRPVLRQVARYEQRLAGDDERIACVPSAMLSLLNIEGHLVFALRTGFTKDPVRALCSHAQRLSACMPESFPYPLLIELCHSLAAGVRHRDFAQLFDHYVQQAPKLREQKPHEMHPALHARMQAMQLLLSGTLASLQVGTPSYERFSSVRADDTSKTLQFFESRLLHRGFAECLTWVDALGRLNEWTLAGVLVVLKALDAMQEPPPFSTFSVAAMAMMDATLDEHVVDPAYGNDQTLCGLYAASGLELLLNMRGLGTVDSHAANISVVRAFLGPRKDAKPMSIEDLGDRVSRAKVFGRVLDTRPGGQTYAYLVLGAAETSEGICERTLEFLLNEICHAEPAGRRLLYHLVREDTRWCRPARQAQLRERVDKGYAFEKSRRVPEKAQANAEGGSPGSTPLARPIARRRHGARLPVRTASTRR